jgi:5-oxoprolinase (ATP-hydrolysing)
MVVRVTRVFHPEKVKNIKAPVENLWQFWIDRGGTFTDVVAASPEGALTSLKLLSDNAEQYEDAAIEGIRRAMGLARGTPLPLDRIGAVKMGTTVATNALLERKGARTVLVTTRGFADLLRIGDQNRPDIFALDIRLPDLLHERVIEVDERMAADGAVIVPLDEASARAALSAAHASGIESCAIVLLHGYRYPDHEQKLAVMAAELGFAQVSVSHSVSPLIRMVGRGDTTVADAYLSPILRRYVERVSRRLPGVALMFMKSDGGLADGRRFRGRDALLSGPAGGVVAAVKTGALAGFDKIIGFDMGGTSTDVCHYAGAFERTHGTMIAGVRVRVPMMDIHTVAAGGGSMLHFDGSRYRVGPDSAGADPGPAAYRRGGPLTVTDCNVMLGKLSPDFFPHIFGPRGDAPLDAETVKERFAALARRIRDETGDDRDACEVADGFIQIAVRNMADAIKKISVERGHDVTDYALNCFGGAGGQHACLVADALGMDHVLIHPLAGVLSAYGMGVAPESAIRERAVGAPLAEALPGLNGMFEATEADARTDLGRADLGRGGAAEVHRHVHLKYQGSDTVMAVAFGDGAAMRRAFEALHKARFGFVEPQAALVAEAISVEAVLPGAGIDELEAAVEAGAEARPLAQTRVFMGGRRREAPVYRLAEMPRGFEVTGPAIIIEDLSTIIIEPGWTGRLTARGHMVLERTVPRPRASAGTQADPVMLEVFNSLFMSIAEQMGGTLRNTAHSVNVKERLDFSCALFDASGGLVANAPHVPVHLGSMGESVAAVIRARGGHMTPGDVFMLNDPYAGGTHLPDVTVVTPVFDEAGRDILFFLGSRAHHADIGGISPGSMPPFSRCIADEGVLITDVQLVRNGRFLEDEVRALLAGGPHPVRNPDQNIADLKAQVAANEMGRREVLRMMAHYGRPVVEAYMRHVQDNAAVEVERVIDRLADGAFEVEMDEGGIIRVAIRVDRESRRATIDFTGTSPERPSNFNAPRAVTRAVVLYVFRCLVAADIPLNEGCLRPLDIIIPEGSMLSPRYPAAVVAGNVEVSQAIADALFAALGVLAASQGTMNNFTFGNARYQHYETLCGGAGAGQGFAGACAVHTHMTNSRLTDPEVLESRFPVRLLSFCIRRGSGGAGQWRGGDGVTRRIEFLEPMTANLLANRYRTRPFGLAGGGAGEAGQAFVRRRDGSEVPLTGIDSVEMDAGDIITIATPGGGGYGPLSDA